MSSTREQGITGSTNPEDQVTAAGQPDESDISHLKSFENVAGPIKLWLVVRTDLGMSLGKTSSEYRPGSSWQCPLIQKSPVRSCRG